MNNKRILILSANTGGGHNSAAAAIREALDARGCSCVVEDGLSFLPPGVNKVICNGHVFLYRKLPKVYGAGYRLAEGFACRKRKAPKRAGVNHKLLRYLEDESFDAIICAHVFAARLVSALRESGKIRIPCYFLATDYSCSPGVNRLDMDGWLIPHRKLSGEFQRQGIAPDKLIPTGIPVRAFAASGESKAELRERLQLPSDRKIALLSCGSMGAGGMEQRIPALLEGLGEDVLLIAVCSSNHALRRRLEKIESKRLMVLGYVDCLRDYMAAADLYLTKPGGLSTTEAVCGRIPMVLFNAVPGVETHNMEFLRGLGCAAAAGSIPELVSLSKQILGDGDCARALIANCEKEFDGFAAERICSAVLK